MSTNQILDSAGQITATLTQDKLANDEEVKGEEGKEVTAITGDYLSNKELEIVRAEMAKSQFKLSKKDKCMSSP